MPSLLAKMPNCWRFKMTIPVLAEGWGNGKTDIHDERIAFLWWWFARALQKPGWRRISRISDLSPKTAKFYQNSRPSEFMRAVQSQMEVWLDVTRKMSQCHFCHAPWFPKHSISWWIRSWLLDVRNGRHESFFQKRSYKRRREGKGVWRVGRVCCFPQSMCLM